VRSEPTAPAVTETRKVLTVLFADITGSTVLGQALDPEPLRQLMARYFDEMKAVVERHEGVVQKFIGDAVMAVFGLPRAHEDDALRAVRAAVEMRATLGRLNEEFQPSWGVTVAARTGLNTGEVLVGEPSDAQALVLGDAVNIAARLEQAAEPGQILIGAETHRLVRDAVAAEPVGPLELKGIGKPLAAWRVLEVVPGAAGSSRHLDADLVGRREELTDLENAFEGCAVARECRLVTVMAHAGAGKSRLSRELLSRIGDRATALKGRCLPYGDGITFWPVASVLRDAAGIGDRDSPPEVTRKLSTLLAEAPDGESVHETLAALLGLVPTAPSIQETFWAVRKLFEHLSARRPLVVVFDDVHWGQPTFLDLLDYLTDRMANTPALIICESRPELLDVRSGWMTGHHNASLIALKALAEAETDTLIRNLVGGADVPKAVCARIAELSEGIPLFVEETLRMLIDDGVLYRNGGGWRVTGDLAKVAIPPSIEALLRARLDRLDPEERDVIQRASVCGRSFWWGAVSELSPADVRPHVGTHLQALMRKQLILPGGTEIGHEDAFWFSHILIQDAAYRGVPKAVRSEMHERLAGWIEERTGDRAGEYEEIVGYHLEQAFESRRDLGPVNQHMESLGRRAAARLASAGQRAFARGDMPAAVSLLTRAEKLLDAHDPQRLELLPNRAFGLMETGDFEGLQEAAEELDSAAKATGDAGLGAHGTILGLWIRLFTNPVGWADEARRAGARAISAFEATRDESGLTKAWSLVGLERMMIAQFASAEAAWEKAAEYARLAGDRRGELESVSWVPLTIWAGPTGHEEGIRRCREVFQRAGGDKKAMSSALFAQAVYEAGGGRREEARDLVLRARAILEELALTVWIAGPLAQCAGWAELVAGDPVAAERELAAGQATLTEIGEVSWLATTVGILAQAVYAQGRYDEADALTNISEQSGVPDDIYAQVLWRTVRAKVLARRGQSEAAVALARESAALLEASDFLHLRWHARMSQGEVLRLTGRHAEARQAFEEAVRLAERKGNLMGVQAGRAEIQALGRPAMPSA
jgi:class 3 adenylate cyclase/tetratricopeptide (TPR) repeat protein